MLSEYKVLPPVETSFNSFTADLFSVVKSFRLMSKLFHPDFVGLSCTDCSAPPASTKTSSAVRSGVQTSMCSLVIADTLIGVKVMPS